MNLKKLIPKKRKTDIDTESKELLIEKANPIPKPKTLKPKAPEIKSPSLYLKAQNKNEQVTLKTENMDTKPEFSKKRLAIEPIKEDNLRVMKKINSEEKLSEEKEKIIEEKIEPPAVKSKDKKRPREEKS